MKQPSDPIEFNLKVDRPKLIGIRFRIAGLLIAIAEKIGKTKIDYHIEQVEKK